MDTMPAHLDIEGKYALYHPDGEKSLENVTREIDQAITWCRKEGVRGLLADIRHVSGFDSPTIGQRFSFISRWAQLAQGAVLICLCARPEMILEDKFGVLIAANRGMVSDVFSDIDEATDWLTSRIN